MNTTLYSNIIDKTIKKEASKVKEQIKYRREEKIRQFIEEYKNEFITFILEIPTKTLTYRVSKYSSNNCKVYETKSKNEVENNKKSYFKSMKDLTIKFRNQIQIGKSFQIILDKEEFKNRLLSFIDEKIINSIKVGNLISLKCAVKRL